MTDRTQMYLKRQHETTLDPDGIEEKRQCKFRTEDDLELFGRRDTSDGIATERQHQTMDVTEADDLSITSSESAPIKPVLLKVVNITDHIDPHIPVLHMEVFNIGITSVFVVTQLRSVFTFYESNNTQVKDMLEMQRPLSINSLTKVQTNIAGVLCSGRHLKMVNVYPTLRVTECLDLKGDFSDIKFLKDEIIIGSKIISEFETVPVLIDREGSVLKTFRSKFMETITMSELSKLYVDRNSFIAYDTGIDLALCFSANGKEDFVFPTSKHEFFSEGDFSRLTDIAFDRQSNIYFAAWTLDYENLVVKLDVNGDFLGRVLLGDDDFEKTQANFILQIDNNDILYVFSSKFHFRNDVRFRAIRMYQL